MNVTTTRLGEIALGLIKNSAKTSSFLEPLIKEIVDMQKKGLSNEDIRQNLQTRAESMLENVMQEFKKEEPVTENSVPHHSTVLEHFIDKAKTLQESGATDTEIREILTYDGTSLVDEAFAVANNL